MNNTQRTSFDIQITTNRLNTLRNYVATKPIELNRKKQEAIVDSLIFHLQLECTDIDRIIKNAKEYEKCYYLTEIEKGNHRRLCKALNQILFDFENELIALGTKRNINWESENGFDFELEFPDQPIKQLLENHLEIAKEFEEFIKIEKHSNLKNSKHSFDSTLTRHQIEYLYTNYFSIYFDCNKEDIIDLFSPNITTKIKTIPKSERGNKQIDIVYFFSELKNNGFIRSTYWKNVIDKTGCIIIQEKPLTSSQITTSKTDIRKSYSNETVIELVENVILGISK